MNVVVAFALAILLSAVPSAAAQCGETDCGAAFTFTDEAGDAFVFPVSDAAVPVDEVDILSVAVVHDPGFLNVTMTVAGLGSADALAALGTADLFYIVHFNAVAGGANQSVAVRVDHGILRQSVNDLLQDVIAWDFKFLPTGDLPDEVAIDGTADIDAGTLHFVVPAGLLPNGAEVISGFSATAQYHQEQGSIADYAEESGFVAWPASSNQWAVTNATASTTRGATTTTGPAQASPGPAAVLSGAILGLAAIVARRRQAGTR